MRQAISWHANEGLSIRQIAIRLTEAGIPSPKGKPIWHPATVDALLRQEAYAGTLYYNRRITRADAPRLPGTPPSMNRSLARTVSFGPAMTV